MWRSNFSTNSHISINSSSFLNFESSSVTTWCLDNSVLCCISYYVALTNSFVDCTIPSQIHVQLLLLVVLPVPPHSRLAWNSIKNFFFKPCCGIITSHLTSQFPDRLKQDQSLHCLSTFNPNPVINNDNIFVGSGRILYFVMSQ